MFTNCFGIEVEFTGITRQQAAEIAADYLNAAIYTVHDYYDTYEIICPDERLWKVMYDGSIKCQKKEGGRKIHAESTYSVELVSPVLLYREDIEKVQGLVRRLRRAGGFTNKSCGIHIHLDGSNHTPRSIWNFINIIASHDELFYKALQIAPERMRYCKKMDAYLLSRMNEVKPKTFDQIESIWYEEYGDRRSNHYHQSRYHFLNLHSFFHGHHTVELRGFNGTLHAGKIRAYIVFALALNHQALSQKYARYKIVQEENEKFAMRTYLTRIGLNGDEFEACRRHLYMQLQGNAAWRYGSRENVRSHTNTRNTRNGGQDHAAN